jgi:DNA-binding LacI/PurR family transcriptional regulator
MGEMAATQLLQRIANPDKKVQNRILLAPELVVRESTGPAPRKLLQDSQIETPQFAPA